MKRAVAICLDIALSLFATWAAYTLRTDTWHLPQGSEWLNYAIGPVIAVPLFVRFGLYRAIFRFTGLEALTATAQAIGLYALIHLVALIYLFWPVFPVTLGVLQPILFLLLVSTSRAVARFWLNDIGARANNYTTRLLIYGAGSAGVQASSALAFSGQIKLVGFVDDDHSKVGNSIHGVPVYSPAELPEVVQRQMSGTPRLDVRRSALRIHDRVAAHTQGTPGGG